MNILPKVSILVAARNEEGYILNCLEGLNRLDYPVDLLDIWIGNDASEDETETIIQTFIQNKPHFYLTNISESWNDLKGKANVLSQLGQKAMGELFFFTDADVEVSPNLLKTMVPYFQNSELGILTGFTLPKDKGLFAKLQALDWTWALTGMRLLSNWQIPTTAMGNNMMVSKKAYKAVGGYESITFSITEDFALYQAIIQKDFQFRNLIQLEVAASTRSEKTLKDLFQQRLRWIHGAWQGHWLLKLGLILYLLSFPVSIIGGICLKSLFWLFLFLKIGADFWLISRSLWKVKQLYLILFFPIYESLQWFFYLILVLKYLLTETIKWKGRSYQNLQ